MPGRWGRAYSHSRELKSHKDHVKKNSFQENEKLTELYISQKCLWIIDQCVFLLIFMRFKEGSETLPPWPTHQNTIVS